jgi:prepilin-type N-terminal cleavage/methylation domain-containing protein
MQASAANSRAFTLTEVLVAIGVIGILVGVLVPALRGARGQAGATVALSNLRGIGITVQSYAHHHRGAFPSHNPDNDYLGEDGGTMWSSDHWALRYWWPTTMHAVAPWPDNYRSWLNDGVEVTDRLRPWNGTRVSYEYACGLFARPEVWSADPAPAPRTMFAPVFTHEVRFPSAKCLMFDTDRAYLKTDPTAETPRGVLLIDGSAAARRDTSAIAPVQNRIDGLTPRLYHDTAHGVRGRDVR